MFITKKKHRAEILGYQQQLSEARIAHQKDNEIYAAKLREARDLKSILDKLSGPYLSITGDASFVNFSGGSMTWNLPDTVAQYVPDHFGGQVLKQEAFKVIEISAAGDITTGLTKRHPGEDYNYVLVRHKK